MALLGCAVSLLASCSDTESVERPSAPQGPFVLRAVAESHAATRSTVDNQGTFSWLKGDEIDVETEEKGFIAMQFKSTGNESIFSFPTGTRLTPKENGYAVSPADINPTYVGNGTLQVTLPNQYTYTFQNEMEKTPTHAPMAGKITSDNGEYKVQFNNLTALLRLHLCNISTKGCRIVVTGSNQLTGNFTVQDGADEKLYIASLSALQEADKKLTIVYDGKDQPYDGIGQYFYIPLPVLNAGDADETEYAVKVYNKYNSETSDALVLDTHLKITGAINRNTLYILPARTLPSESVSAGNETKYQTVANSTDAVEAISQAINAAAESQPVKLEVAIEDIGNGFTLPTYIPDESELTFNILQAPSENVTITLPEATRATTRNATGKKQILAKIILPQKQIDNEIKMIMKTVDVEIHVAETHTSLAKVKTTMNDLTVNAGVKIEALEVTAAPVGNVSKIAINGTVGTLKINSLSEENKQCELVIKGTVKRLQTENKYVIGKLIIDDGGELGNKDDFTDKIEETPTDPTNPDSSGENSNPENGGWDDDEVAA